MKTRSTKKTLGSSKPESQEPAITSKALDASNPNPPRLYILPQDASANARFVTLPDPARSTPTMYYFCPEKGIYEFTRIAAPKSKPSSWLLAPGEVETSKPSQTSVNSEKTSVEKGYVLETADLTVATPLDPLFILLPYLSPSTQQDTHNHYLSLDDHLDAATERCPHLNHLLPTPHFRQILTSRMSATCDTVEAMETMYRLSMPKLLAELLTKAERMTSTGLPASMEAKFVTEALQAPVTNDAQDLDRAPPAEAVKLQRIKTALDFLLASYVPAHIRSQLRTQLSTSSPVSFAPLDAHMARIETLRKEAQALRSLSDNISRKRQRDVDEEAEAAVEEKKRKKEEEDKQKKLQSRGVQQLKKVDTKGMMKLSSFFTKAPKKG